MGKVELAEFRPQAVVFDNDGLLVDTEWMWHEAEAEVCARRGRDYPAAVRAEVYGTSVPDTAIILGRYLRESGNEPALIAELEEIVGEVIAAKAVPMPGAAELIERLHGRVPIAVATNSTRSLLELTLKAAGLREWFEVTVSVDEVAAGKPAPDLYLAACASLGVDPDLALAFEDSPVGVAAARAAGMRVVGVPNAAGVRLPADWVLSSLADPIMQGWAQRL